jgi:hypothetical protein
MGYIDKQVSAYRKSLDDASTGANLRKAIRQLQEKSQINDTLKPLKKRGNIVSKAGRGKRTGSGSLSTELRELRSTDGLFVVQYYHVNGVPTDE